jgi:hypothetical protein
VTMASWGERASAAWYSRTAPRISSRRCEIMARDARAVLLVGSSRSAWRYETSAWSRSLIDVSECYISSASTPQRCMSVKSKESVVPDQAVGMAQIAMRSGPDPRNTLHPLGLPNSRFVELDGASVTVPCQTFFTMCLITQQCAMCTSTTHSFLLYATTPSSFINNGSPSYFA